MPAGRAKDRVVFVCAECGRESPRWMGQCPDCGAWNSMAEEVRRPAPARAAARPPGEALPLGRVEPAATARRASGIGELDRILGGGIVPGSVILLGGDPGVGKSTLLLQASRHACAAGSRCLYVTGEESLAQLKLRAERVAAPAGDILVMAENDLAAILAEAGRAKPDLVVIDSVQTLSKPEVPSAPGSVSQVRECAADLVQLAKRSGAAVFLVGHVTKQGAIAGPRVLEHMVDTVLYFEGDRHHSFRIVRAVKNRFGPTNEVGVFEMRDDGLAEVDNPSEIFLSEYGRAGSGSVVVPGVEGTRTLLVEIQALVSRANFGTPERKTSGVDRNRVAMLLAVLERRGGLALGTQDTFVNVVGGVQVDEPAADLGIALAIASSFHDRPVPPKTVVFGEIGLGGEVRAVTQAEGRLRESAKLGFTKAIVPAGLSASRKRRTRGPALVEVTTLAEALNALRQRDEG